MHHFRRICQEKHARRTNYTTQKAIAIPIIFSDTATAFSLFSIFSFFSTFKDFHWFSFLSSKENLLINMRSEQILGNPKEKIFGVEILTAKEKPLKKNIFPKKSG